MNNRCKQNTIAVLALLLASKNILACDVSELPSLPQLISNSQIIVDTSSVICEQDTRLVDQSSVTNNSSLAVFRDTYIDSTSSITNNSQLVMVAGLYNSGTLKNTKALTSAFQLVPQQIQNFGLIINSGQMASGLTNAYGGVFNNSGEFTYGSAVNYGTITNSSSGTMSAMNYYQGPYFTNFGNLINYGAFNTHGVNGINNNKNLQNDGTIRLDGGTLANTGTITNSAQILLNGVAADTPAYLANIGVISGAGSILSAVNWGGSTYITNGGLIEQQSISSSSLSNSGVLRADNLSFDDLSQISGKIFGNVSVKNRLQLAANLDQSKTSYFAGDLHFAGSELNIELPKDYIPNAGDILYVALVTGATDGVNESKVTYSGNGFDLSKVNFFFSQENGLLAVAVISVPEPDSVFLLAAAMLAFWCFCNWRGRRLIDKGDY